MNPPAEPPPVWRLQQMVVGINGSPILAPLNWCVRSGERWVVQGPSGTGKSLLLSTLVGLLPHIAGTLEVAGAELPPGAPDGAWAPFREKLGVVFQQDALYDWLSVRENIMLKRKLTPGLRSPYSPEAEALKLGLAPTDLAKHPSQLSGGMARRVALLRALAHGPSVVVLDEPTAGLDTAAKESTLGYVMAYCKAHSATLVFTTHDPDVALAWATHTLALVPAAPIA